MAYASDGGEFAVLLRDLRALVGCEALLVVTHDLPTLAYLLTLTAQKAASAADAARRALERVESLDGE